MKKFLAILSVMMLASTSVFASGVVWGPKGDKRPAAFNQQSCFSQVDWDLRHTPGLVYPWSVVNVKKGITVESQVFKDAQAKWDAAMVAGSQKCYDQFKN